MTAEVAILNKTAVALAADSAVTTGYPGREKIFTSANKIFTLSKVAPVGIMINGHVEFCGVPWETIIKEYRKELGTTVFPEVADYVRDFEKFVGSARWIDEKSQTYTILISCMSTSVELENRLERSGLRWNAKNINKTLDKMAEDQRNLGGIPAFSERTLKEFTTEYGSIVETVLNENTYTKRHFPQTCFSRFRLVVYQYLVLQQQTLFATGLVIAGFGEKEIFPKLFELTADGAAFDTIRMYESSNHKVERNDATVFVSAFAQGEEVESFITGVASEYDRYVKGMIFRFVSNMFGELLTQHTTYTSNEKKVLWKLAAEHIGNAFDDFENELAEFRDEVYRRPIEDVLRVAPKDELASIAESLVSLASLKRRVSDELETVKGPIDVAVISKGDGFIWIKRKHYFKPELNMHFSRNYFRGIEGGSHE